MAQIKFFRGNRDYFFSGVEGAFNETAYGDAICFLTDSHELVVNGEAYGLSDTLKDNLEGKVVVGGEFTADGLVLSYADGSKSEAISIPTVSESSAGLMSSADKSALDALVGALLDEDNKPVLASKDNAGLLSAEDFELLQTLSGAAGAENVATRLAKVETDLGVVSGSVSTLTGEVVAIREDIGNWSDTAITITQAIGGLDGRVGDLEDQISGLSGAMHFRGVLESLPVYDAEKADQWDYAAGDVVIVGQKEYVCVEKVTIDGVEVPFVFVEFGDANNLATTSQLQAVEKKADDNTSAISTLSSLVEANSGDIESLTTLANNTKSALEELAETVKSMQEDTTLSDKYDELAETVAGNSEAIETNSGKISALEALVETNKGGIADNLAALNALTERVAAIEDADKSQEIIDLTERVDGHDEKIEAIENILTWNDVTAAPSDEPQA